MHDDGFYRQISPFDEAAAGPDVPRFHVAMHGLARVVSHPERGLALLDGGKRDFPYDEGLPIPRRSVVVARRHAPPVGLPADRFALARRGAVAAGAVADLVLVDPDTVADRATYAQPRRDAVGIDDVFVAGVLVLVGGELTRALPGSGRRGRARTDVPDRQVWENRRDIP